MKPLTIILIVLAAGTAFLAWMPKKQIEVKDNTLENSVIGKDLNKDQISRFRITQWDEGEKSVLSIEVAQKNGTWCITSREDYPADGGPRVGKILGQALGLKYGRLVSGDKSFHKDFGVLDPEQKSEDAVKGDGLGKRVVIYDQQGAPAVDLIIGKSADGVQDRKYVRTADSSEVYLVKVSDSDIIAKFVEWVERDLMKISRGDIRGLEIDEHAVKFEEGKDPLIKGPKTHFSRPDSSGTWTAAKPVAGKVINTSDVDKVLDALTGLRVNDISRRQNNQISLQQHGFFIDQTGRNLFGAEGATRVTTKDGMTFHLYFGQVQASSVKVDDKDKKDAATEKKPNRYMGIFVMYDPKVDEDKPKPPEADKKPDEKKDAKPEEKKDEKSDEDKQKEYEKKLKEHLAAREKKCKKLNDRFDNYFYVISDEDFKKLRPKGETLFKDEEKPKAEEKKDEKKADAAAPGPTPAPAPEVKPAPEAKPAEKPVP